MALTQDSEDVSGTLTDALAVLGCRKSTKIDAGCISYGIFSEENPGDGGKRSQGTLFTIEFTIIGTNLDTL